MQKKKSEKRARMTQAERSAATRKVLLDASVRCLFEHGYGQTTTILIAEMAGISRGALLHQFSSKADLMVYVVEAVFEEEAAMYRELQRENRYLLRELQKANREVRELEAANANLRVELDATDHLLGTAMDELLGKEGA